MSEWGVVLNGIYLSGGDGTQWQDLFATPTCSGLETIASSGIAGFLTVPPDGLGLPELRVEDVTYVQQDGVTHFNDWYEARTITLDKVSVCPDSNCLACGPNSGSGYGSGPYGSGPYGGGGNRSARQKVSDILQAWKRTCDDVEMVIFTDCNGQYDLKPSVLGPSTFRTNLIKDPSFEGNPEVALWTVQSGAGVTYLLSTSASGGYSGQKFIHGQFAGSTIFGVWYGEIGIAPESIVRVTAGDSYALSAYMRVDTAGGSRTAVASIYWYDGGRNLISTSDGVGVALIDGQPWTRVSVVDVAPVGAVTALAQFSAGTFSDGDTCDFDAVLFEQSDVVGPYFDGDSTPSDNPTPGGQKIQYAWSGSQSEAESVETTATYELNADRSLYGPFGVIGRPRVAQLNWVGQGIKCAEVTLRFDAVDHRMYVLDECGTPGYQKKLSLYPYTASFCVGFPFCFESNGTFCFDIQSAGNATQPITVVVGGTECVFPTITLMPGLSGQIMVENTTTQQFLTYDADVVGYPVIIDTQDMTATQNGASMTHLLSGSLTFGMDPGEYQIVMSSSSPDDDGYATVAWRDTVIMA